jgi:naphtho-gamma-pyrone polyketide synthase
VASSRTIGELIPVAVEAVVIALRLGLCALKVHNSVGRSEGSSQSWSAVVSGMEEEQTFEFIREFSTNKVISKTKPPDFFLLGILTAIGSPSIFTPVCQRSELEWLDY